jgi:hypothetical protein
LLALEQISDKPKEPVTEPAPSPLPWVIGGAAVTVVGLGIGIGLTVAANNKGDEAATVPVGIGGNSACYNKPIEGACKEVRDAVTIQQDLANGAVASYAISGGAAVATVATYLLWPKLIGSKKSAARVVPWVSPGSAGIVGTF